MNNWKLIHTVEDMLEFNGTVVAYIEAYANGPTDLANMHGSIGYLTCGNGYCSIIDDGEIIGVDQIHQVCVISPPIGVTK